MENKKMNIDEMDKVSGGNAGNVGQGDLDILSHSVNPIRLKNNPVLLNEDTIYQIYKEIVKFV